MYSEPFLKDTPIKRHLFIKDKLCGPYRTMAIQFYLLIKDDKFNLSKTVKLALNYLEVLLYVVYEVMTSFLMVIIIVAVTVLPTYMEYIFSDDCNAWSSKSSLVLCKQ